MSKSKGSRLTNDWLAARFIKEHEIKPELNLLYVRDRRVFYRFDSVKCIWEPYDDEDFYELVYRFVLSLKFHEEQPLSKKQNVTTSLVEDVVKQIRLQAPIRLPSLVSSYISFNDQMAINTSNPPFAPEPAKRSHYALYHVPAPSTILTDEYSPPLRFLTFLHQVLVMKDDNQAPDPDLIMYVQQMMGYCLIDSVKAAHAFFLYGSGANGKSVLLDIIAAMFPEQSISASTLQSLTSNRFALATLRSKRLNITNEEESKYIKSDLFKKIVNGEKVEAEEKFEKSFKFAPRVKLLFATNKMPRLDGVEHAIARRLKIIPFYAEIPYEKQDPALTSTIIEEELPLVIAWALKGAEQIVNDQFKFQEPQALKDTYREYEEGQSSALEFIYETYDITGNKEDYISRSALYNEYVSWSDDAGRKCQSRKNFIDELYHKFKKRGLRIPTSTRWDPNLKKNQRIVSGIKRQTN